MVFWAEPSRELAVVLLQQVSELEKTKSELAKMVAELVTTNKLLRDLLDIKTKEALAHAEGEELREKLSGGE